MSIRNNNNNNRKIEARVIKKYKIINNIKRRNHLKDYQIKLKKYKRII